MSTRTSEEFIVNTAAMANQPSDEEDIFGGLEDIVDLRSLRVYRWTGDEMAAAPVISRQDKETQAGDGIVRDLPSTEAPMKRSACRDPECGTEFESHLTWRKMCFKCSPQTSFLSSQCRKCQAVFDKKFANHQFCEACMKKRRRTGPIETDV